VKAKEFTVIEKQVHPHFSDFAIKGKMMLIPPASEYLRGIYFENSSGTEEFYVRALLLPLFIPQEHMSFNHGERLKRNGRALWRKDEPNLIESLCLTIRERAIPFLNNVSTLPGILDCLKAEVYSNWPKVNSHHLEELAYVLVKMGDNSAAFEALANLKKMLAESDIPWVPEQLSRAELIESKLRQSRESALAQLDEWRKWTIAKLGLEKYQ